MRKARLSSLSSQDGPWYLSSPFVA